MLHIRGSIREQSRDAVEPLRATYIFASEHSGCPLSPSSTFYLSTPSASSSQRIVYSLTMSLENAPGFYNPTVQTWQGANSTTFKRPELDTNLTLPELFEYHAKHSPEHPVFVYADDEQQEHVIRFPEVFRGIRKAATISSAHYNRLSDYYTKAQVGKSEDDPPVIGILATAGA